MIKSSKDFRDSKLGLRFTMTSISSSNQNSFFVCFRSQIQQSLVVIIKRHDRGCKRSQTATLFKSNKKEPFALVTCFTCDLIYMPCSAPVPPTMAVKELDLQTIQKPGLRTDIISFDIPVNWFPSLSLTHAAVIVVFNRVFSLFVRMFSSGLAWTAMGGEIMFVEATRMGGEGKLTLTGQLGMCLIYIYLKHFLKILLENQTKELVSKISEWLCS